MEIMPYDPEKRVRPRTIQDLHSESMIFLDKLQKEKGYGVFVLDSINGLFDEKAKERAEERVDAYRRGRDYEEKTMGMEFSKYLSTTFFKDICPAVEDSNAVYVIVAQYRQKQLVTGGTYLDLQMGEALKYYANKRVKLTLAEEIIVKGKQIGAVVRVETKKARGPWPYRHAYVTMYYTTGIDNVTSNIDYLYDLRTDTGKLSAVEKKQKLSWDDEAIDLTRDEMIRFIEANNLEDELARRVIEKWEAGEAEAVKSLQGRKKRFQD